MDQNVHKLLTTKIRRGQSLMEYTIIIGIVVGALVVMQVYMKRGIQAAVRVAADQLAPQSTADIINLEKGGYLKGANSITREIDTRIIKVTDLTAPPDVMDMRTTYDKITNTQSSEIYIQGEYEEE